MTNPTEDLISILNANWNEVTVKKPKIVHITDASLQERKNLALSDYILADEVSYTPQYYDATFNCRKDYFVVSLDIRTALGRTRLNLLFDEVQRIITSARKTSTTTHITKKIIRRKDLCNSTIRLYRMIVDVELYNHIGL